MSDQFLGEIRMVGFNFAPFGWAVCTGQLMSIAQNTALFSLLGTMYGGDGKSNFALPNFQAQAVMGAGNGGGLSPRVQGETSGEYTVSLQTATIASHNHGVNCFNSTGNAVTVANNFWAKTAGRPSPSLYAAAATNLTMSPAAVGLTGGAQPHNNLPPYVTLLFVIALNGIFPPRG